MSYSHLMLFTKGNQKSKGIDIVQDETVEQKTAATKIKMQF